MSDEKIKVIPCSGIGKVFGLITREVALRVANELCPEDAETLCLSYVVTGDDEVKQKIEGHNCITIDGCATKCAAKNVAYAGGIIKDQYSATEAYKNHRGEYGGTATILTDAGWQMVDELSEKIADKIKNERGDKNNG